MLTSHRRWHQRIVQQHIEQHIVIILRVSDADVLIDYKFKLWLVTVIALNKFNLQLTACPTVGEYRITGHKTQVIQLLGNLWMVPHKVRVLAPTKVNQWLSVRSVILGIHSELEIEARSILGQLNFGGSDGARVVGGTCLA